MRTDTTPTGSSADTTMMRAVTQDRYGDSQVLRLAEIPDPPSTATTTS